MAKKTRRQAGRKRTGATGTRRKAGTRTAAARSARGARTAGAVARKAPARKAASRKRGRPAARTRTSPARGRSTTKPFAPPPGPGRGTRTKTPALDRKRRTLEETVPTPPSSLDMDRHGSAARTGHAELQEKLTEHTQTSPAFTAGDIDANWEEAYSSGDEAPGGDNPTPDQGVVDDIGKSLGVEYEDNEELKGSPKIDQRDTKRWELDPASSEDYKDRNKR